MSDKKIVGFKKFSDIKSKTKEVDGAVEETPEVILPNPNLPKRTTRTEKPASLKEVVPSNEETDVTDFEESVKTYGRVAKFPKNVKASKAFNFLENVKISKKSIWYIMIESQSDELQMVKYNYKEGVDLSQFVNELKAYYISNNKNNASICEAVSKIEVDGNDKFSKVKNISKIKIDGKLLITKITEDLIQLLSK